MLFPQDLEVSLYPQIFNILYLLNSILGDGFPLTHVEHVIHSQMDHVSEINSCLMLSS